MSKVFRFLPYSLLIFLALIVSLMKTVPAFAVQPTNYKGVPIDVSLDPKQVMIDGDHVTFTITAPNNGTFDPSQSYSYSVFPGEKVSITGPSCPIFQQATNPDPTGTQLVFTWKFDSCRASLGKWHLIVWMGKGTSALLDANTPIIVPDYPFEIEQPQGGTLRIEASRKSKTYGLSETPQVNLYNARANNWYEFWWDGAGLLDDFATKEHPSSDGNVLNISLRKIGSDFTKIGPKKLCMQVGNDSKPFNLSCSTFFEYFKFDALPPPPESLPPPGTPNSCHIDIGAAHVPNPAVNDSVGAGVTNLPPNQQFKINLLSQDETTIINSVTDTSDKQGVINVNLKDHIDLGTYKVTIVDANNVLVCTKDFTVTQDGSSYPKTEGCQTTDCTKAGEDSGCDVSGSRGPAIKTAIGCIHTNPAEFVKDMMTFIIGISGGLAFLLMILGAFQMLTSAGNPETLHAGRERLTSAVIGLLIVIFATLLLQIIGLDILQIPGFKR